MTATKFQSANRFAFKEWAVVCAALDSGLQSVIFRKGGIHEGREGFRIEHREFWLFPTNFHQRTEDILEEARPLLAEVVSSQPPPDRIHVRNYAVVEHVVHVADESLLPRLAGQHVWSHRTLSDRFHYRTPGLFALLVRILRLPEPIVLPDSPHFSGCRSWVDFPDELPTDGLVPVLPDAEHDERMQQLREALSPIQHT